MNQRHPGDTRYDESCCDGHFQLRISSDENIPSDRWPKKGVGAILSKRSFLPWVSSAVHEFRQGRPSDMKEECKRAKGAPDRGRARGA